jgi:choline transport protein
MMTVGIGLVVGLAINIAMFFAANDLANFTSIVALLYDIYDENPACAYALGSLLIVSVMSAVACAHAWHSRVTWALSRDKGTPFHAYMSRLAPAPYHTPLWATVWGACWISLCGFLYLGSITAFNSFVAAGICLQYITYATPAALLLLKGRKTFPHGPFFWPRFGPVANVVVIGWCVITVVMYSFPYFLPVAAESMNYLSAVLVFAFLYAAGYWILYGSKNYELVDLRVILD